MTVSDIVLIAATLLGPILAVQAQKFLERRRETINRRQNIFKTLMATRASRLSPQHVEALNSIEMEFRGKTFKRVLEKWKENLDHFSSLGEKPKESEQLLWTKTGNELYIDLLYEMGQTLGFDFDRVQISKGIYSPAGHYEVESDLHEIRRALKSLLTGKHALKMDVVDFPDFEDSEAQVAVYETIQKLMLEGQDKNTPEQPTK